MLGAAEARVLRKEQVILVRLFSYLARSLPAPSHITMHDYQQATVRQRGVTVRRAKQSLIYCSRYSQVGILRLERLEITEFREESARSSARAQEAHEEGAVWGEDEGLSASLKRGGGQ